MLKLTDVNKVYELPNFKVEALKDINISFRSNEFVSILGPSGSGKTTLLNIIGGLDQYTSGDLEINGRSTRLFKEKDWDVYRNHRVGFVFQSYNLIPHQTVLSNVELALAIAGLNKEERTRKAKIALDKVGLSDQYYKKPSQLSGGQSQRVAIARALVNDPEILLADEPTGALDTQTSKQILDLIKEIASDRLVIMVTHNSKLAEEYSTRIINLLDGKLIQDSDPLTEALEKGPQLPLESSSQKEKAKMGWWTTFKLSLQNLFSKKRRTALTSVASSIGIIGISLVLSLSFGVRGFINAMQSDMLSGNPITIESKTIDFEKMMEGMGNNEKITLIKEEGKVNVNKIMEELTKRASRRASLFVENNITDEYLEFLSKLPAKDVAAVVYDYGIDFKPNLYFDYYETSNSEASNKSLTVVMNIFDAILKEKSETKFLASMLLNSGNIASKAPASEEYILEQYNLLSGKYATEKNEVMLVLNDDRGLADLFLAQLGYYSQEEFINIVNKAANEEDYDAEIEYRSQFDYEELMSKTFTWHPNDAIYSAPPEAFSDQARFLYEPDGSKIAKSDKSVELKVVGILEPNESIMYGSLKSGFYYTEKLCNHILNDSQESEIVKEMERSNLASYTNMPKVGSQDAQQKIDAVLFSYDYTFNGETKTEQGVVGNASQINTLLQSSNPLTDITIYSLTKRDLGGELYPSKIQIYPVDLIHKDNVISYLNSWNTAEGRLDADKITLTDPLSLVFAMLNNMINMITIALVGFTTLALLVSSVMIAIITYVSVVERTKEIGVIRSLGGRKRDVSNLFVAETALIGFASGFIAVVFTYIASALINLAVYSKIGFNIAVFPIQYAFLMLGISIFLTLVSGRIPSRSAAKKDPVVALRAD